MQGKTFFLQRAISRSPDWSGRYPALGCACHDPESLSRGRQIVAASLTTDGVRCVFFSAVGSVLDFTATWDELARAKTWWYFVQRWYCWAVPDERTLARINVTPGALDHVIFPSLQDHANDEAHLRWLDGIEARARRCGTLAVSRLEFEPA
ncbi:hypothetical protein [Paraburkholderia dilworthii]|uniref:hypothetical protein n=1 Tax=Paraburkholderia dilworthii TaxID=948106 RepID=UPI00040A5233|nr:hypothetical protein [Paraburkholderia dilworthii]